MLFFLGDGIDIKEAVGVGCDRTFYNSTFRVPGISMHRLRSVVLITIVVLALLPVARAQSTTGSILGDASDSSGAVLPGATVRTLNERTGASRETFTNETGSFRFSGLAPDRYTVTVELTGFRVVTRPGVILPVAGEVKLDFELEVGEVSESVTVTEVASLVQTTESTIRTVVDNRRVEELPLRNRDFMDLMLLAPGVTLDQSSVRRDTTDSVSFFGMGEQYKSIWLEGVDFNDEVTTGGTNISPSTRTRIGQEAIQEFQVMSTGYSAEFGRTATGAVNVVIKSGGNDIHGSGFYFLRDDSFDKPPFAVRNGVASPISDPPDRRKQQFGGTIGGPIVRDRAFFFGSFERQVQDTSTEVSIPDDVESFVNALNLGYDTSRVVPQNREEINTVGKFSFNLNRSNTLNLTYLYDDNDEFNKDVNSSIAADGGFDDLSSSYFASANLTSLFGTGIVNEFRLNRSIQRLFRSAPGGSTKFLPTLVFPSVEVGTSGSVPQGRTQKNWILANTMSHQFGNHGFKWGAEMNDVAALVDSNNGFNGSYLFTCEEITCEGFGKPARYTSSFNLRFARRETSDSTIASMSRDLDMYAFFVNDTWRARPNFTLNMGLRYDLRVFEGDIGGPDPFEQPGFSRDHPEDVWLAVALGQAGGLGVQNWRPAPNDTLDLSPRFGFSWDVLGTGKAVVRASYGIFHDRIDTITLRGTVFGYNGLITQSVQVSNPDFFPIIPNAAQLPALASGRPSVPSPSGNTPYTQQSSGGFQYEITPDMAFSADFTHILGLKFGMNRNVNAPLPLSQTGGRRVCPLGEKLKLAGQPECLRMRLSLDQGNRIHINTFSLRLERRFTDKLGFLAGYTLGDGKQFSGSTFGPAQPVDAADKFDELDFGPLENDVRHRLTANVIYALPYEFNLSSIVTANSAPPYDHTTGSDDNLDFIRNDRPEGVAYNALRGDGYFQMDLRLSKKFSFDDARKLEILWEMFNVSNTRNLSNFNGNERSSTFRKARAVLTPFQAQLGLKFIF